MTATIVFGVSTGYANAQTPPWLHRPNPQVIVCASLTDVYDVAVKDRNTKDGADFTQLLKEGKCASVPAQLVDFWWYFDHYEDGNGHPGYISEVSFAGIKHHLYTITATLPSDVIQATGKPEFKDHSRALASWFKNAKPTPWAYKNYEITYCCEYAERVKTKFEMRQGEKYGTEEWWFQCTSTTKAFCDPRRKAVGEWVQIPSGIVHEDDIKTPTEYWGDGARFYVGEQEMSKVRAEFEQLRTEGVMFFYKGEPVCFWPPKTTW